MLSTLRVAARSGRLTPVLVLATLGLLLVPVQCAQGVHSIFVPAITPAFAAPVDQPHHQHAAHPVDHHAAGMGEVRDGPTTLALSTPRMTFPFSLAAPVRTSAPERSTPSPVQSAMIDHPYTAAMSRSIPSVDPLSMHLRPLVITPLAPDAIGLAPDHPPPRSVA